MPIDTQINDVLEHLRMVMSVSSEANPLIVIDNYAATKRWKDYVIVRSSYADYVREFHDLFGVHVHTVPTIPTAEVKELRKKLIKEEYEELMKAIDDDDIVNIADGCADLHYVVSGTSLAYGIPEEQVFHEVHRSNMSKADPDGTVHKRPDGKVLKSVHYTPANVGSIIQQALNPDPGRAAFDAGPVAL